MSMRPFDDVMSPLVAEARAVVGEPFAAAVEAHFEEALAARTSPCRSGCPTQDCGSYVACLKSVRVAYCNSAGGYDYTRQKRWDGELSTYRDALKEGIEPADCTQRAVDKARRISDVTQQAYVA